MPRARDPLAALAALERRFDGPLPAPLRLVARHGTAAAVELLYAVGQAAFFRHMVVSQRRAIRLRRAAGGETSDLCADLAFYRRRWHHWRRAARQLGGDMGGAG